ncbi:BlaI/MecI/CopY family transcriptional regulator [Lachnospiraceae bacterium ZAX-1]
MEESINQNVSYELSKRELDVMNVLWAAGEPTIASDIPKLNPKLSINTVQVVLKNLMKSNFVKVDNIVYHKNVLARSFAPIISAEEYALKHIQAEASFFDKYLSKSNLIARLIDDEDALFFEELEAIIQKRKKKL